MFHPQGPTFFELAREALSSTRAGYDMLAPKFDYTPFRTPQIILDEVGRRIGQAGIPQNAVDLCCGTGAAMEMLLDLGCPRVTGVDMSCGMLDVARQRLDTRGDGAAIELRQADILDSLPAQQFDFATCFGALGHILPKDEPRFVQQIHHTLQPAGRFCFVTTDMPSLVSFRFWAARCFNGAMHIRNLLIRPPFVMFYLTFLLPACRKLLQENGFDVKVEENIFTGPFKPLQFVTATKN